MRHAGRIICPGVAVSTPTHAMLKMDEATYRALYFGNILGRLDAEQLWEDLHRLSYPHEPVLLC